MTKIKFINLEDFSDTKEAISEKLIRLDEEAFGHLKKEDRVT